MNISRINRSNITKKEYIREGVQEIEIYTERTLIRLVILHFESK